MRVALNYLEDDRAGLRGYVQFNKYTHTQHTDTQCHPRRNNNSSVVRKQREQREKREQREQREQRGERKTLGGVTGGGATQRD